MTQSRKAVVLLSGGLDSATVLAMAQAEGFLCHTVSFDYGQRHRAELDAAAKLACQSAVAEHKVITLGLDGMGGSALTDESLAVPVRVPGGVAHDPSQLQGGHASI